MNQKLAVEGGKPVRDRLLPYGHQWIDQEELEAVRSVLFSDWLTTGPRVSEFEEIFSRFVGTREAVAVSSGTAALHAVMFALDIRQNDEVIVPALTFTATANSVVFQGGRPIFADVRPDTLLIDPQQVRARATSRTRAVVAMDYAGQACEYDELCRICQELDVPLVADACHALGGRYRNRPVGQLAGLSTFSFHPVKAMTTGEGGMITTDDPDWAQRLRLFRNHGLDRDFKERDREDSWRYDMVELGYNYRLTDLQSVLGIQQLGKIKAWIKRRRHIASRYHDAFSNHAALDPLVVRPEVDHAYHLYVIRLRLDRLNTSRDHIFKALRAEGIGVNVHYRPVYLHSFYQQTFSIQPGICPAAESAYSQILSLPIFPAMTDADVEDVIRAVDKVAGAYLQ